MGRSFADDDDMDASDFGPEWALVYNTEDPLRQGRIKVIIPAVDPEEPFGAWVRPRTPFAGAHGFGIHLAPEKGTEVLLTGLRGDNMNLFYTPVFNEDHNVPPDSIDSAVAVMRFPGDLKIICEGNMQLEGGMILIKATFGPVQISSPSGVVTQAVDEGSADA